MIIASSADRRSADSADRPSTSATTAACVTGLVIGRLAGWHDETTPLVEFDGNPFAHALTARMLTVLGAADTGSMVALQFELGDICRPVVLGLLHGSASAAVPCESAATALLLQAHLQVTSNEHEVRLVATRKLTLQCGRASITLDVDGNVEIRGQDLLSRAAGQNRIKGSSVSLN